MAISQVAALPMGNHAPCVSRGRPRSSLSRVLEASAARVELHLVPSEVKRWADPKLMQHDATAGHDSMALSRQLEYGAPPLVQ